MTSTHSLAKAQDAPTPLTILFDDDPYFDNGHGRPDNELSEAVLALLVKGADPNVKDNDGVPVLVKAAELGYATSVRLLIEHKADVNARTVDGLTALMVGSNYSDVVEELLLGGADVTLKDKEGKTVLRHVAENFNPEKIPEILQTLLDAHADINTADNHGLDSFDLLCLSR